MDIGDSQRSSSSDKPIDAFFKPAVEDEIADIEQFESLEGATVELTVLTDWAQGASRKQRAASPPDDTEGKRAPAAEAADAVCVMCGEAVPMLLMPRHQEDCAAALLDDDWD